MHVSQQFLRYVLVGLASNATAYLAYLALTWLGLDPKLAMTCTYLMATLQAFVFNRRWSFRFKGPASAALYRYASAYALGYLLNLLVLWELVDRAGWSHQLVQAMMVVVMAILLFLAQRYWVFAVRPEEEVA